MLELSLAAGIAAIGVASAVNQGEIAKANAKQQQKLFEYNARQEELEANYELEENKEQVVRQREQQEALQARQRALLGKSGAAMTSGSPLAVLGETARKMEIDTSEYLRSGYSQYSQRTSNANLYRYQASMAKNSYSPFSTILNASSSVVDAAILYKSYKLKGGK